VGGTTIAAVYLPAIFSRSCIDRQQVRIRQVIAEKNDEVAEEDRRTSVTPERPEGRELYTQVTRPDEAPFHVEGDDLTVAEPGVHALAVGDRRRGSEIVFLVDFRQRPGCLRSMLPQPAAVLAAECFHDQPHVAGRRSARVGPAPTNRMLALRERPLISGQLGMRVSASQCRSADL
jgi:hypothetical protein